MSLRYPSGFISAGFNPLEVPNAPTIGTATSSGPTSVSVTFTAPANVGGSAITGYVATARKTSDGTTISGTGSSSPVTISGLTTNSAYTVTVAAVNSFGAGPSSAASNSVTPLGQGLYSWGLNGNGQLGLNDVATRSSPVQVGASVDWFQIASGARFSLSIKTDGSLWSWGYNNNFMGGVGNLGLNDTANRSSPVQVGALTTWSQVAGGQEHSLAIKTDGTLWSWGRNSGGRLGLGNIVYRSSPVQVGALTTWSQIAGGYDFSLAAKTDGTMWSWGTNGVGQLGLGDGGSYTQRSSPVQIGALTTWSQIASGNFHSLAVKTDGTLWGWGRNSAGQLGLGDAINRSSPVQVGALTTWSKIAAGSYHSLAIKTDGTMWSWGDNGSGRLGLNDVANRSSPVQIGALTTWSQVAGGQFQSLAIKTNGTLWGCGFNTFGSLGLNDTVNCSSPVQVGSLTNWWKLPKMPQSASSLVISIG